MFSAEHAFRRRTVVGKMSEGTLPEERTHNVKTILSLVYVVDHLWYFGGTNQTKTRLFDRCVTLTILLKVESAGKMIDITDTNQKTCTYLKSKPFNFISRQIHTKTSMIKLARCKTAQVRLRNTDWVFRNQAI